MSTTLNDNLPEVLKSLRTRPLFVMRLGVRRLQIVGAAPGGYRRIGVVPGGSFEGERLSGEVLDGGNDWQTVRPDGASRDLFQAERVLAQIRLDESLTVVQLYKSLGGGWQ